MESPLWQTSISLFPLRSLHPRKLFPTNDSQKPASFRALFIPILHRRPRPITLPSPACPYQPHRPDPSKAEKKEKKKSLLLHSHHRTSKMCPTHSAEASDGVQQVNGANGHVEGHVAVETPAAHGNTNGFANGQANGTVSNGHSTQPFKSRAEDLLSNVSSFKIIESTLRGGFPAPLSL